MLKYIYEKFFQKFVIEDIAECFDSFEKQHKDILTNHCRCTKREYTYSATMAQNQFGGYYSPYDKGEQNQFGGYYSPTDISSGQSVEIGGGIRTNNPFSPAFSQGYISNGVYQPQHHICGNCGKPITEQSNLDVYNNVNGNGDL